MPTIRDVADQAGVHPSTVSRVFSGNAKISDETRARVLSAAQQLGFQPNAIARSLSVRRTETIAAVVPHVFQGYFEDAFFPQVMSGLLDAAYPRGFRILLSGSNSHADEITQMFQILGSRQADGIVVLSTRLDVDTVGALRRQSTPFVILGRPVAEYSDICWVDTDSERYTAECVRYLINLGHQRIAYVGGDPEVAVTRERQAGYQRAMDEAGLPVNPNWIVYGYFAENGGYRAVHHIKEIGETMPTAFYAANDLMAIGVMRALRELDLCVPTDVSVIGTNDAPEAKHIFPALTTLRVPYAKMATKAAELLIDAILSDEPATGKAYIPSRLIVRDSTAPCKTSEV